MEHVNNLLRMQPSLSALLDREMCNASHASLVAYFELVDGSQAAADASPPGTAPEQSASPSQSAVPERFVDLRAGSIVMPVAAALPGLVELVPNDDDGQSRTDVMNDPLTALLRDIRAWRPRNASSAQRNGARTRAREGEDMEVDSSDSDDSGDEVPSEEGEPSGDAGTPRDVPARPPRDPLAGQVSAAEEGNDGTANAAIVAALHDFPLAPQQRAVATTLLQYALEWRTHRESRRGPAPRPPKLLVHGGPGTGKTYTMTAVDTALRRMGLPGLLCCAFTASAAILLPNGETIHRMFRLSSFQSASEVGPPSIDQAASAAMTICFLAHPIIVVDEVSMVSPRLLTQMDARLKQLLTAQPFGGKCVVLQGDMFQIMPPGASAPVWATVLQQHGIDASIAGRAPTAASTLIAHTTTAQLLEPYVMCTLEVQQRSGNAEHTNMLNAMRSTDLTSSAPSAPPRGLYSY